MGIYFKKGYTGAESTIMQMRKASVDENRDSEVPYEEYRDHVCKE